MSFEYRGDALHCEEVDLRSIAAEAGTPCYVYSGGAVLQRFREYGEALRDVPHRICYAVKANSNLGILRLLAQQGAGFDIVSGGELYRVLQAGGDPNAVVFSGVGKTGEEIEYALRSGIHTFNCESPAELQAISDIAVRTGTSARLAFRANPDVDASTHPYISTGMSEHKFGIDIDEVEDVYRMAMSLPGILPEGVSCHIGSQLLDADPLLEALDKMLALVDRLRSGGVQIRHLDVGGGLGVPYKPHEQAPAIGEVASRIAERVKDRGLDLMLEPGRSIVGEAGVLLTSVLYRKRTTRKEFVVVDAAMNDLIRPALYKSWHEIVPVKADPSRDQVMADIVGPICETGDFLAKDREMPEVDTGELLAIRTAGAYGFTQASNYNSRRRACEVIVEGSSWRVVRKRETYEDLVRGE